MKDYALITRWLDAGHPYRLDVCATNQIDAISEAWQKLPTNRHKSVDRFEIVSIRMCSHKKGVVV